MAFNGYAKRSLRAILHNRAFSTYRATTHSNKLSSWTSEPASFERFSESPVNTVANNPCRSVIFLRRFGSQVSSSDRTDLIKLLRERTCAPIKDVKAALVDSDWDIEEAQKELRKKGKVLASKKSDRTATEGLLALAKSESKAALIELNCETDFVARNDIYQHLALALAKQALVANPSQEAGVVVPIGIEQFEDFTVHLEHEKISGERTVKNAITDVAAMMGENVKLGRGYSIGASENGVVSTYLHSSPQPGLGPIAGVVTLEVEDGNLQSEALQRVGSELAMHVVAARPLFLTRELVTSDALQNEREVLMSQAKSSGKPQIAIEKMVEGRMGKYYEDVVLMEQKFIVNDSINVKVLLDNLSKEVGSPVKIGSFFRMEVGEGVQRIKSDSTVEPVAQSA